jgi:UDP-2,4-diacetamido-2,4,6-trideoxy-beta-L-altropyranose hydrolase
MPGETLLIRADAGAEMGAGHVMRCIALAQAWQKAGGRTVFALATGTELEGRIRSQGAEVVKIKARSASDADADETAKLCSRLHADWLVIDGYHFSDAYRRSMRALPLRLLLMSDGVEGDESQAHAWKCDIALNPDPDVVAQALSRPNDNVVCLHGSRYALLRREFLDFRGAPRRIPDNARRVLVTLGGGDNHNVTHQVLDALTDLNHLDLELTLVVGASYQYSQPLQAAVDSSRQTAKLLRNADNMPELMAQADLAITAGGGTCYELAFMQVPMFLITMAKNHERAAGAFASAGAAFHAGWFSSLSRESLAASLCGVIGDGELRTKLITQAGRMVDGKGAERVVEAMHAVSYRGKASS